MWAFVTSADEGYRNKNGWYDIMSFSARIDGLSVFHKRHEHSLSDENSMYGEEEGPHALNYSLFKK